MNSLIPAAKRLSALIISLLAVTAQAGVVYTSGTLNSVIPDDTDTGVAHTMNVDGSFAVSSVTVNLNLSVPIGQTGWTGDLYAYLQHGTDFSVLLNRPGRTAANPVGYGDGTKIAITLEDSVVNGDIHGYRSVVTGGETVPLSGLLNGSWAPDGRLTDPALSLDTDLRTALLNQFNGTNPNGTWTLFLADLSGGGQFRLDSWQLSFETLSAVPEPAAMGAVTVAALTGFAVWRRARRRMLAVA